MLTSMKKLIASISIAAALGGGAFVLNTVGPAAAQSTPAMESQSTSDGTTPDGTAQRPHRRWRRARVVRGAIYVSAETIGIPRAELVQALRDGQSIAQVAEARGVSAQTVIDAIVQAGSAKADEAVAAGTITQQRADAIKARLPQVAERIVNRVRQQSPAG